jgi:uncharacterized membrane protein SpoIIM required for sporulation/uncharacterized RDD family membrane protein YckC
MTADTRAPFDLRQEHGVETPEHVEVRLDLAGVGSRTAAALLDLVLLFLSSLLLNLVLGQLWANRGESVLAGWGVALLLLINAFLFLGYFAICEAVTGGRTPGKQALGIRTVMDTGKRITPTAAVVRAVLLLVDVFFFAVGLFLMAVHRSNKRLGDMAAGTIVVRDRPVDWSPVASLPSDLDADTEAVDAGPPLLSNEEFRLLDQFLARAHELDPAVRARMRHELVRRFEDRAPRRDVAADAYLVDVLVEEQRRRRGRFATRARAGVAGRTTVTAERFASRRRAAWSAFDALARRVERGGVGSLPPQEIPPFAARYREVTADLARARTYGLDPGVIAYLEGLVSAGHNALYRGRGRRRTALSHYLLRDFPAAVVSSWRHVVAAFLLFIVPAAIGFTLIRERPELTESLEHPVMIDRAERAAAEERSGRGYAQAEAADRPAMSAFIMSNNIRVSFNALAGGMLAGVLTVLVLVVNGFQLGVSFGVFANHGAAHHLATFIVGHGVLELTAIFISAGAGFRLAGAIIAPGDRTRKDALVVEGMVAARMIGAVATLLVLAGLIEGLLSASDASPVWKFGVGGTTAGLLVLYFANGARHLRTAGGQPSQRRGGA